MDRKQIRALKILYRESLAEDRNIEKEKRKLEAIYEGRHYDRGLLIAANRIGRTPKAKDMVKRAVENCREFLSEDTRIKIIPDKSGQNAKKREKSQPRKTRHKQHSSRI